MSSARINQTLASTNPTATSFSIILGDKSQVTIGNITIKTIITDVEAAGILRRMKDINRNHPEVSVRHNRSLNPNKR